MMKHRRQKTYLIWFLVMIFILVAFLAFGNLFTDRTPADSGNSAYDFRVYLKSEDIMCVYEQGDIIWAGGKNGVFKIRKSDRTVEKIKFDKNIIYVKSLCVDDAGSLWVSHEGGLMIFDGDRSVYYDRSNGLPDNRVNVIYRDDDGLMWIGTWGGLAVYDHGGWRYFTKGDGLKADMVNVIMKDTSGNMWFGAYSVPDGGVSILRDGEWQYSDTTSGLPNDNVCGFAEDGDGAVWAATGFYDKGGASRFVSSGGIWAIDRTLLKKDGLAGEKVRSIFRDRDGNLFLGSEYDGLAVLSTLPTLPTLSTLPGGEMHVYTEADGLSSNEIKSIIQDADGNIWMGTRTGVTVLTVSGQ